MRKVRRLLFFIVGSVSFALGGIGIFIPGIPTTIFWIVAAICYLRSSEKMYKKIISNPHYGPAIKLFIEERAISARGKRISIISIVVMSSIPIIFVPVLAARIGIAVLALVGIVFLLSLKTVHPTATGKETEQMTNANSRHEGS